MAKKRKASRREEVIVLAEMFIELQPYPGLGKLAESIGCAPNTLRRAIADSPKLTAAKRQFEHPLMTAAEDYIARHGYPGLERLALILGCLPKSLRRVIRNSDKLIVHNKITMERDIIDYGYGQVKYQHKD